MDGSQKNYLEWKKKGNNRWNKISQQINAGHVVLVALAIFFGHWLWTSGRVPFNFFIGVIITLIIVVFFLASKESAKRELIPEPICKMIAREALEQKQKEGKEIPFDARIEIGLASGIMYEQDLYTGTSAYIKREIAFTLSRRGWLKKGVIGIHPYDGTVLDIRFEPLGYSGRETKDKIIVPTNIYEKKDELN